ncbi:hypothetical protein [Cellulomonas fimi]|uniref:Uncharacterized protein n=1 Tax=Cellulomonas fimi TaxID=1708 RepID=A0A7Y0QID6_CELFI|nr:hypothetical protein [Cellulomonas fimi]NMR20162.1 hypothetical protein [Cellulomonas fimi]
MRTVLQTPIEDRERGIAMIMVIGVGAVLAGLVVAAISYSLGGLRKARSDQDWNAAIAAAYAGVEEYQSRLANDTGYFLSGNPSSTFSNPTAATPAPVKLPTGAATNSAFGVGATGTWAEVPGSSGAAQYRYEIDNSRFNIDGTLRLRSTGRSGDETRTIVADLKQQGFIDFLYFTDYEVMDPTALNPTSTANCAIRYPGSRPGCSTIYFGGADVIKGPLHTNDTIQTNGAAKFQGKTTTGWQNPSGGANYLKSGTTPTFSVPGDPSVMPIIGMPPTNSQIKKETRTDLADVPNPGCLYTGPTSITFTSDGKMQVISPWTKATRIGNAADSTGTSPAACGTPGSAGLAKTTVTGGSTKYVGQEVTVFPNMVIYVQNVPNASGNVNGTPSSDTPPFSSTVKCESNGNSLGYPVSKEDLPFTNAYGCKNGDAFVEGTVKGNVTVAAENYIYVTDDLEYEDDTEDMLGLIGNNAVWVWNPMDGNKPLNGSKNRKIDAAILSVAHTFMVQNYNKGNDDRGTLSVYGAIAQKFRGPVGTGSGASMSTGYGKDYVYDERFRYTAPPKFLSPVTTTYGVNVWVEVSPVMNPDGSYR